MGLLVDSLATTKPLAELFSDESLLRAMLTFEIALASAEARAGIVPQGVAETIKAINVCDFDASRLADDSLRAGTPSIPFVKALTARVRAINADAARFVHWGATSQDLADTALILLLKRAHGIIFEDIARLGKALCQLSTEHANTVMVGRTLLQGAPPTTFGLKVAGWAGAVARCTERLESAFGDALVLQLGGASGTLAALGERGLEIGRAMADELGLAYPEAPWHTHRDRLAFLVVSCGVLTGSLGKMARDISLLMQGEVAEAFEGVSEDRGGSSTMPQKRNPIASMLTLAAANRVPGLVASFLYGMIQEHERAVGGWQAEWSTLVPTVQSTGLAVQSMVEAVEHLEVDKLRMRENVDRLRGSIFAERAMILLGQSMGRDVAHQLLKNAVLKADAQDRRLSAVLAEMPEVTKVIDAATLQDLENPEHYLGVSRKLQEQLLSFSKRFLPCDAGSDKPDQSKTSARADLV